MFRREALNENFRLFLSRSTTTFRDVYRYGRTRQKEEENTSEDFCEFLNDRQWQLLLTQTLDMEERKKCESLQTIVLVCREAVSVNIGLCGVNILMENGAARSNSSSNVAIH